MSGHDLTAEALRDFHGTERWFRHWCARNVTYTEGVEYLAEHGGAYWLIDLIALAQKEHFKILDDAWFQVWTLRVHEKSSATLTCDDGNGRELVRKRIPFTDFPLPEIQLYCCRDGVLGQGIDWVILLPGEY